MGDSRINDLHRKVFANDWKALKEDLLSFQKDADELILLLQPISVHGDSIIHLVVHSGTKEPLQQILCCEKLTQDRDLLYSFTMSVNNYGNTVLHEAAISGNLAAVELLVEKNKDLLVKENDSNETPLFKAAAFGNTKIVKFLATCKGQTQTVTFGDGTRQLIDVHRKNKNGDTVLFAAVQGQHFGTALELLKFDEKLTELEDGNQTSFNMLVQIPSAFKTQYETMSIWKKLLFFCVPVGCDHNDDSDNIENRHQDMEGGHLRKVGSDRNREMEEGGDRIKCSGPSGLVRLCLYKIYISIWRPIIQVSPLAKKIWKEKRDHGLARELAWKLVKKYKYSCMENLMRFVFNTEMVEEPTRKQLFAAIRSRNVEAVTWALDKYPQQLEELNRKILNLTTEEEEGEQGNPLFAAIITGNVERVKLKLKKYPQQLDQLNLRIQQKLDEDANPLFAAIREGNVELVKLILEEYPQALDQTNIKNQNILHVAAMYRQKEIFNFVKTKKVPMIRLARQIDIDGYTILHSVADTQHYKGGTHLGPAYKLQEELKWFDSVKEIMPSSYIMLRDKSNMTALEIFKKEHDDQLKKARSWIKETSKSCSGVAILVASAIFAAAFTLPGGTNDNNGFSILLQAFALSCSFSYIVMFLSILASSFELEDFRASLPRKLTIGFMLLVISVVATMLTFTTTIVHIIRLDKHRKLPVTLLCSAAFSPVFVLAMTDFSLIFSFIKGKVSLVIRKFLRCLGFFGNR